MLKRIVLVLLLVTVGCSGGIPKIFQIDPVGATLYSMKTVYEGTVRSVGLGYVNGQVDQKSLEDFTTEARRFHATYNVVLNLHNAGQLVNGEKELTNLRAILDELQSMAQRLLLNKKSWFFIEDWGDPKYALA